MVENNFLRRAFFAPTIVVAVCTLVGQVLAERCEFDDARDVPILWEHDHFRGACIQLHTSIGAMHAWEFGDRASSLAVPAGWTIVLYEHTNFGGDILVVHGPAVIPDLSRDKPDGKNWGDRISSVKVIPPQD